MSPSTSFDDKSFGLGILEETTVNTFVDSMTLLNQMATIHDEGHSLHLERYRIKPSNYSEAMGMGGGFFLSFLVPGPEEVKGASIVEHIFANPSVLTKFNTEAHAAELAIFLEKQGLDRWVN